MPLRILLLSAGACALATAAYAQQVDSAEEAAQFAELHERAKACNWLPPVELEALRLGREDQLAYVEGQQGAQAKATIAASAKARGAAAKAKPCTGAEADKVKTNARGLAQDQYIAILFRADAMAQAKEPYAFEITTLRGQAAALKSAAGGVQQAAAAQGQGPAFVKFAADEAVNASGVLKIICAERVNFRTSKPRPCPAITPQDQAMLPYARSLVTGAETLAPQIAVAQAQAQVAAAANAKQAQQAQSAAKTTQAIAKYGDMSRYWKLDHMIGGGEPPEKPAECTGEDILIDLKDAKRVDYEDYITLLYAPVVRLDGGGPPSWSVFSEEVLAGRHRLIKVRSIKSDDFKAADLKKAFDSPPPARADDELPAWLAAPEASMDGYYLDELHLRAQGAVISQGLSVYRQCRGS